MSQEFKEKLASVIHPSKSSNGNTLLNPTETRGSISMSPEMFEKLYFSPQTRVKGDLRMTFGNPTPIAVLGLVMSLTPLSCDLMGWRGAGGNGAASTGVYFFFGGLLMLLGGFLEFLLGNTFPFVLFCGYGSFWLSYGATLQPFYSAYGAYSPDAGDAAAGLATVGFNASFAFYLLFMGLFSFACTICAMKTNLALVGVELFLTLCFSLLAGAFFQSAQSNPVAGDLQIAGGACGFVAAMCAWYLFFALMFSAVELPFSLPVGDLSQGLNVFKRGSVVEGQESIV